MSLVFDPARRDFELDAFLTSLTVVGIAEIGDKTQLLSILMASKFRRPLPIIFGVFFATLANHTIAGEAGKWIADLLGPDGMRWVLATSFIGMSIWALIPDKLEETNGRRNRRGAFVTTLTTFFMAEMGDKTQIVTVALAAKFDAVTMVIAGTTAGMMAANVPAILLGHYASDWVAKATWVRFVAAIIFAALGISAALGVNVL